MVQGIKIKKKRSLTFSHMLRPMLVIFR